MARKTKKKKRICCVGFGCPEWRHCIHVLGDGDKWRPKSKSTLKRMKKCLTSGGKSYKKCMKRERKKSQKLRQMKRRRKKTKRRRTRKRGGGEEIIPRTISSDELVSLLRDNGVTMTFDFHADNRPVVVKNWGEEGTKPLSSLLKEIKSGETTLKIINGKLIRTVDTVGLKIYDNEQKKYLLYELSHHNRLKEQDPKPKAKGNGEIGEKMNPGENPRVAIKRGIKEELGKSYSENILFFKGAPTVDIDKVDIKLNDSHSYPGLLARYRWYRDEAYIPNLTTDTLYPSRGKERKTQFFTKELKDNGTFKRWIQWEWRKT